MSSGELKPRVSSRRRRWIKAALALTASVAALSALGSQRGLADVKRSPHHIEVRGATSMLDFAERAAEGYMGEHPEAVIAVSAGGPRRGLKSVLLDTADIALFSGEYPDDLAKLAKDKKIELTRKDVYRDAVVVVVHPKNPVADLPMWKVREIFRGSITNWKDLGGKDAPIVVVNQESSTGAFETFKRQVLGDNIVVTPKALTGTYREFDKHMTEFAIGYIGKRQNNFKAISIDGVSASTETLESGAYPIQRHLSVVYRASAPPDVAKLVDYFLAPDKGQTIVRAQGDVPVK